MTSGYLARGHSPLLTFGSRVPSVVSSVYFYEMGVYLPALANVFSGYRYPVVVTSWSPITVLPRGFFLFFISGSFLIITDVFTRKWEIGGSLTRYSAE